jgi:hypothetical protein
MAPERLGARAGVRRENGGYFAGSEFTPYVMLLWVPRDRDQWGKAERRPRQLASPKSRISTRIVLHVQYLFSVVGSKQTTKMKNC